MSTNIPESEFGITELLKQTCEENLTKEYDLSQFKGHYVVRRGNNVYLEVAEGAEICLKYQGRNPNIEIKVTATENQFEIPETCIPGKYKLFINNEEKECLFYIIFNSWNSNCPEFFENETQRNNFIMQEAGWVDQGSNSVHRKSGKMWMYNQFDGQVLNDIFELIQGYEDLNTEEDFEKLRHPAFFTRAITNVIGTRVLQGNWSGQYDGGKTPNYWKTSEEIISEAVETGSATKYGQCWVFSAVTVTFCRALGLACRSVTNKGSAHDYGANLEIDYYVDESDMKEYIEKRRNGERVPTRGQPGSPFLCGKDVCVSKDGDDVTVNFHDSIWNFHVWNNVWFGWSAVGDFSDVGNFETCVDGWNAIDACPQEESDGIYQCGPSPLKAISTGLVENYGYDARFIFSEVNADVVEWAVVNGEVERPLYKFKNRVGKHLWAARGDDPSEIEDVMIEYKPKEGTEEAALVYKTAKENYNLYKYEDIETDESSSLKITIDSETFDDKIGEDMTFKFEIKHETDKNLVYCWLVEKIDALDKGTVKDDGVIVRDTIVITSAELDGRESTVIDCVVPVSDYFKHLQGKNLGFKLSAMAVYLNDEGKADGNMMQESEVFQLGVAGEMIGGISYSYADGSVTIHGVLKNTVGCDLTNVAAVVQGEASGSGKRVDLGDLAAGEEKEFDAVVEFKKPGLRRFNVTMDTDEVPDIIKNYQLEVKPEYLSGIW